SDPSNEASDTTHPVTPQILNLSITVLPLLPTGADCYCTVDVNLGTESAVVEYEFFQGPISFGRQSLQTIDTVPGGTGYRSTTVRAPAGADSVKFYVTPYSGPGGTGTAGAEASDTESIP